MESTSSNEPAGVTLEMDLAPEPNGNGHTPVEPVAPVVPVDDAPLDPLAELLASLGTEERIEMEVIRLADPPHLRGFFARPTSVELKCGRLPVSAPEEAINLIRDSFGGGEYRVKFFKRGKHAGQRTVTINDPPGLHLQVPASLPPPAALPVVVAPATKAAPPVTLQTQISEMSNLLATIKEFNKQIQLDGPAVEETGKGLSDKDRLMLMFIQQPDVRREVLRGIGEMMGAKSDGGDNSTWWQRLLERLAENIDPAQLLAMLGPLLAPLLAKLAAMGVFNLPGTVPATAPASQPATDAPAADEPAAPVMRLVTQAQSEPETELQTYEGTDIVATGNPLTDVLDHVMKILESEEDINAQLLAQIQKQFPSQFAAAEWMIKASTVDYLIMIVSGFDGSGYYRSVLEKPHVRARLESFQALVKEQLK